MRNLATALILINMNIDDIICLIKKKRKSKGLTQKDLANKLCISYQQYNHYETRHSEMSLSTFLKILEILEVDISDFFFSETTSKESVLKWLQENLS